MPWTNFGASPKARRFHREWWRLSFRRAFHNYEENERKHVLVLPNSTIEEIGVDGDISGF